MRNVPPGTQTISSVLVGAFGESFLSCTSGEWTSIQKASLQMEPRELRRHTVSLRRCRAACHWSKGVPLFSRGVSEQITAIENRMARNARRPDNARPSNQKRPRAPMRTDVLLTDAKSSE